MGEPQSNLHFRVMCLSLRIRDLFLPRKHILMQVGIREGFHVLDYGCGPGSYVVPVAELVGESGKVYGLDIHPLAIQRVRKAASKRGLRNVETILSDCETGLADGSVDVVLLYDAFHEVSKPDKVLEELRRVLKAGGILSFSDHHMKENEVVSKVTEGGLFRLSERNRRTYTFVKAGKPKGGEAPCQ